MVHTHLSRRGGDEQATQARRDLVAPAVMAGVGWLLEVMVRAAAAAVMLLLLLVVV